MRTSSSPKEKRWSIFQKFALPILFVLRANLWAATKDSAQGLGSSQALRKIQGHLLLHTKNCHMFALLLLPNLTFTGWIFV